MTNRTRLEMVLDVCAKRIPGSRPHQQVKHVFVSLMHSWRFHLSCLDVLLSPLHVCVGLKKILCHPISFLQKFRKKPSEHARMNTLGWNSISLFKHHTSNDTLFESNEHVSGRHNDNDAVRFRHRTCLRFKYSQTFRHPQCSASSPFFLLDVNVSVRAYATDCVDVCAVGCACHLMRHACVTVPLAGAASSETAPAAGFCVSLLFVECHHEQFSMSSSHRCGWLADGQAEKEQPRNRVTPARPWSPYPRDRGHLQEASHLPSAHKRCAMAGKLVARLKKSTGDWSNPSSANIP